MKSIFFRGEVVFLSVLLFMTCLIPIVNSDNESTSVSIEPVSLTVVTLESNTIGVYCNPITPMKSFEFNIRFDPSLLSVTDVREGTIFDGYSTFFNDGSIDNINGEINHIYGLILGPGNVKEPGFLIWIDFQANQNTGQSVITLSDVGITNSKMYISITISNGLIDIQDTIQPRDTPSGGMYVWDISLTRTGRHLKSSVTIRRDSDNDGITEITDKLVKGAKVYYTLTNQKTGDFKNYIDTTDKTGTVTFTFKKAPAGQYGGLVNGITHSIYVYNPTLDIDNTEYITKK